MTRRDLFAVLGALPFARKIVAKPVDTGHTYADCLAHGMARFESAEIVFISCDANVTGIVVSTTLRDVRGVAVNGISLPIPYWARLSRHRLMIQVPNQLMRSGDVPHVEVSSVRQYMTFEDWEAIDPIIDPVRDREALVLSVRNGIMLDLFIRSSPPGASSPESV